MSAGNEREFIDHLQNKEGKEQAMKCPLRRKALANTDGGFDNIFLDCLKEECAWWSQDWKMCAIPEGLSNLLMIANHLGQFIKKMPHAGKFTK